jgi:hypothetical protein
VAEAKGKRAQEVKAAAKAAGVNISKELAKAGSKINKAELDAINKKITKAGGTAVSFETTAKGVPAATGTTKTVASTIDNGDGTFTIVYTDGTTATSGTSRTETASKQQRTNWKEFFKTTLTNWGLTGLIEDSLKFVDQGFTDDVVVLKLQETPAWKQRFAANEQRRNKGLDVIDPATYLQLESDYQSAMRAIGLPRGFYDSTSDFTNLIAADLSPAEFNARLSAAAQVVESADPLFKQELRRFYGLSDGDMIAYTLDPEKALPVIERKVQTVQFGTEAARQGISVGLETAETFGGTMGVTQEQARSGFQQIASLTPDVERLSAISRRTQTPVTQEDVISFQFGGSGAAETKKRIESLAQEEMSRFAGQSGVGAGSLTRRQSGQF